MQVYNVSIRLRHGDYIATVLLRGDSGKKQTVQGKGATAKVAYENALASASNVG